MGVLFANGGVISSNTGMGNIFNNHSLHKNGGRCNKGQKMNERIEKLNRLALGEVLNGQDPDNDIGKMYVPAQFTKKFAELIVRECIELIDNKQLITAAETYDEVFVARYDALEESAKKIREHFGVEE